jgi:two-component system cell cycle response regulator DivK
MSDRSVLIVDDDSANRKLAAYLLARKGYRVSTALDAQSALRALRDHVPDLILLDLHLPDMDGLALMRRIKDDPATSQIRVLLITGRGFAVARPRA